MVDACLQYQGVAKNYQFIIFISMRLQCPRKLARVVRFVILGVFAACLLTVVMLLVGLASIKNQSDLERFKSNSSILRLEQLQRGLLSELKSDKVFTFSELDKTTRGNVVKRVFDISPKVTAVHNTSEFSFQIDSTSPNKPKFLFVLSHYEQLGKTTENLFQLAAVAANMKRSVVQPF